MIAGGAAAGALTAALFWSGFTGLVVKVALGFISLIAMGGVLTEMTDACTWVYYKHRRWGVECESCGHINPIRPWSL